MPAFNQKTISNSGLALGLILGLCCPATYTQSLIVIPAPAAKKEAYQINKRMLWHTNLAEALNEARRENKLVFWVHMLGNIDGKT